MLLKTIAYIEILLSRGITSSNSRIYKVNPDKWFEYLKIFALCENSLEKFTKTTECSEEVSEEIINRP